jgi:hypothetical protein
MIKLSVIKIIYFFIFFLLTINLSVIRIAHSSEFEIEQNIDGGIHFRILELEDLKAQGIATHHLTIYMKITN